MSAMREGPERYSRYAAGLAGGAPLGPDDLEVRQLQGLAHDDVLVGNEAERTRRVRLRQPVDAAGFGHRGEAGRDAGLVCAQCGAVLDDQARRPDDAGQLRRNAKLPTGAVGVRETSEFAANLGERAKAHQPGRLLQHLGDEAINPVAGEGWSCRSVSIQKPEGPTTASKPSKVAMTFFAICRALPLSPLFSAG